MNGYAGSAPEWAQTRPRHGQLTAELFSANRWRERGGHCLQLCARCHSTKLQWKSSESMVTQRTLVKLDGSQRKTGSNEYEKKMDREREARVHKGGRKGFYKGGGRVYKVIK